MREIETVTTARVSGYAQLRVGPTARDTGARPFRREGETTRYAATRTQSCETFSRNAALPPMIAQSAGITRSHRATRQDASSRIRIMKIAVGQSAMPNTGTAE